MLVIPLLWAAGCDAASQDNGAPDAAAYSGNPLSWQSQSAALERDGSTAVLQFDLPRAAHVFALRAYPVTRSDALSCFTLRDVVVNDSATWVGADTAADSGDYCSECEQRVSIGAGYGFAILPSAAGAALELSAVSARIALRDCLTLTAQSRSADSPSELRVELASWSPPEPSRTLRLPLAVVIASRHGLAADAKLLPAALDVLEEIWAVAGIRAAVETTLEIEAPEPPLLYSAVEREALDQLARRAGEALRARNASLPVLILAPCLLRTDILTGGHSEPWAMTSHLPGGAAVRDVPDAIYIAAERCEGLTPAPRFTEAALLGAVMAHELGHYLGLYHVAEQNGREDQLSDTDVSEPNLMRATPSASATRLSASQVAIARRHSAFATLP